MLRRFSWSAFGVLVVMGCIEPRNKPQQQAQAYPQQQPPPGYYPQQGPQGQYPPGQYPPQQYPPNQYPPQQYPPNQYPPNQYPPNQQRPPQGQPTGQPPPPAPQPTQQQPAPQPTQQQQQPNTWGGLLDGLLKGGAPPLQWPPGPAPTPTTAPTTSPTAPPTPPAPPAPQISQRSLDLANAINNYRKQNNLPPIPISKSLSFVAETHVKDLHDSAKPAAGANCNGHSWSNKGNWTPCCYTPDHAQAKCMWAKPSELTQMKSTGFEITVGQPGEVSGVALDSNKAISAWQSSPLHNDVILNRGQWQSMTWKAMGAGIIDSHACAWFSDQPDPTP